LLTGLVCLALILGAIFGILYVTEPPIEGLRGR
jgi:hypothetical protein